MYNINIIIYGSKYMYINTYVICEYKNIYT